MPGLLPGELFYWETGLGKRKAAESAPATANNKNLICLRTLGKEHQVLKQKTVRSKMLDPQLKGTLETVLVPRADIKLLEGCSHKQSAGGHAIVHLLLFLSTSKGGKYIS